MFFNLIVSYFGETKNIYLFGVVIIILEYIIRRNNKNRAVTVQSYQQTIKRIQQIIDFLHIK